MDLEKVDKIKKIAIIAMFSDDELMDLLVLKGGNAIDLIYRISSRASIDLDFSIQNDFEEKLLKNIEEKFARVLKETFLEENYMVFDIKFEKRPEKISKKMEKFWGGYSLEFKIIDKELYEADTDNVNYLRKYSVVIGPNQRRKFNIDISKYEYCQGKKNMDLDGYTIYIYSPEMIVFEKIRAICQQSAEYKNIVRSFIGRPRARDFFDIFNILGKFSIDINSNKNKALLKRIFNQKKVPLKLINEIEKYRDFHVQDYVSLKDTIRPGFELMDFDFYFDFVVKKFKDIV